VRALDLEPFEQLGGVLGQLGDRERLGDPLGKPDPAVVEGDDVEALLQGRAKRLSPGDMRTAHPLDQQQRLAGAGALVMKFRPPDGDFRHRPILRQRPAQPPNLVARPPP
jgi:hypothetical protein